ncbi:MAG TPA: hypothetical protein VIJ62_10445 [Rhizomicrobium sp.]
MTQPKPAGFGDSLTIPLFVAFLAYCIIVFAPQVLNDGDTYWHITTGERMIASHAVISRDPFSYTFAGAPWQTQEWLSEVLMAAAYMMGGWNGLVILFGLAGGAAAGFLAFHLGKWLDRPSQLLILFLGLCCAAPSLLARPHLLALPILELWTMGLLFASHERRAPSWLLLPLMTLWANLHGSFLLGLALVGLLGVEALLSSDRKMQVMKDWGLFGVAALIAALITPHGIEGIIFPVHLMSMTGLSFIGEWQSASFEKLQPLELVIFAALYVGFTRDLKLPPLRILILILFLYLALQHARHQIVFAIVAPLLLAEGLAQTKSVRAQNTDNRFATPSFVALAIAMLLAAGLRFANPIVRKDDPVSPITALAHVPAALAQMPVLNDYAFGGYLIFKGVKPFIDSRADLYGDAYLQNYATIIHPDRQAFDRAVARYRVRWAMFNPASPVLSLMESSSQWQRLYADKFAVVYALKK